MSSTVFNTIKNRRSVRRFSSANVPKEVIQRVFDAAQWAPSAHNSQPWRFVVVSDLKAKQKLAKSMSAKWKEDLQKDGVAPAVSEKVAGSSVEKFTSAPVMVVACLSMKEMDSYRDETRRQAEFVMGVQSVAAAVQNLLLAAHAEGLGGCWYCAPLFCPEQVRKALEIPENVYPQALLTLGYPDESPRAPARKPLESIVYQDRWENL
jgi:F420 biosynthesis protein FbiB-like protein